MSMNFYNNPSKIKESFKHSLDYPLDQKSKYYSSDYSKYLVYQIHQLEIGFKEAKLKNWISQDEKIYYSIWIDVLHELLLEKPYRSKIIDRDRKGLILMMIDEDIASYSALEKAQQIKKLNEYLDKSKKYGLSKEEIKSAISSKYSAVKGGSQLVSDSSNITRQTEIFIDAFLVKDEDWFIVDPKKFLEIQHLGVDAGESFQSKLGAYQSFLNKKSKKEINLILKTILYNNTFNKFANKSNIPDPKDIKIPPSFNVSVFPPSFNVSLLSRVPPEEYKLIYEKNQDFTERCAKLLFFPVLKFLTFFTIKEKINLLNILYEGNPYNGLLGINFIKVAKVLNFDYLENSALLRKFIDEIFDRNPKDFSLLVNSIKDKRKTHELKTIIDSNPEDHETKLKYYINLKIETSGGKIPIDALNPNIDISEIDNERKQFIQFLDLIDISESHYKNFMYRFQKDYSIIYASDDDRTLDGDSFMTSYMKNLKIRLKIAQEKDKAILKIEDNNYRIIKSWDGKQSPKILIDNWGSHFVENNPSIKLRRLPKSPTLYMSGALAQFIEPISILTSEIAEAVNDISLFIQESFSDKNKISFLINFLPIVGPIKSIVDSLAGKDIITGRSLATDERISRALIGDLDAFSTKLSFVPIVGNIKDGAEAAIGRDVITWRELEDWERALGLLPLAIDKISKAKNILKGIKITSKGIDPKIPKETVINIRLSLAMGVHPQRSKKAIEVFRKIDKRSISATQEIIVAAKNRNPPGFSLIKGTPALTDSINKGIGASGVVGRSTDASEVLIRGTDASEVLIRSTDASEVLIRGIGVRVIRALHRFPTVFDGKKLVKFKLPGVTDRGFDSWMSDVYIGASTSAFRTNSEKIIAASDNHPLKKLLVSYLNSKGKKAFKFKPSRKKGHTMDYLKEHPDILEMGHMRSKRAGGEEIVVLMSSYQNQRFANDLEKGLISEVAFTEIYEIGGIGVHKNTAHDWLEKGIITQETLDQARTIKLEP